MSNLRRAKQGFGAGRFLLPQTYQLLDDPPLQSLLTFEDFLEGEPPVLKFTQEAAIRRKPWTMGDKAPSARRLTLRRLLPRPPIAILEIYPLRH